MDISGLIIFSLLIIIGVTVPLGVGIYTTFLLVEEFRVSKLSKRFKNNFLNEFRTTQMSGFFIFSKNFFAQ